MSIAEEIEKLDALRQSGALSEQEFQQAKQRLLDQPVPVASSFEQSADGISIDPNMWGMFIHLSQLCGFIVPVAGLVAPIVIWQVKKNDSEIIDRHGRIVVNWVITELILGIIFTLLCFILIGFPLLFALMVVGIIFPIVGAVKANNGEVWRYPCSYEFFTLDPVRPNG